MYLKWILATAITAVVITGCGGDNDPIDPVNSIDMADYAVTNNGVKNYKIVAKDGNSTIPIIYEITNEGENKVITEKLSEDMILTKTTFSEQKFRLEINLMDDSGYAVSDKDRFVDVGDTVIYFNITDESRIRECKIKEELNGITFTEATTGVGTGVHSYSGEILKLECKYRGGAMFDTYQVYMKKGEGLVAEINHSCVQDGVKKDQNYETCTEVEKTYRHRFFIPAG